MKAKHVTYWIATVLISAFMAFVSFAYLSHQPKMMSAFASLGYPTYFPAILGVAKMLGVVALLVPGLPHLKEWAYAGFTFTFLGAILSHLSSGQQQAALMPLASLIMLAVSYATRPADRRPVMESAEEHRHHFDTGLPVS
jgi:hypothetical protein